MLFKYTCVQTAAILEMRARYKPALAEPTTRKHKELYPEDKVVEETQKRLATMDICKDRCSK